MIAKNTNRAKEAISQAQNQNVLCYSLSNSFEAKVISNDEITAFLAKELGSRSAKLTQDSGKFTLRVHSNLWYEWPDGSHDFVLDADDIRRCSRCGRASWYASHACNPR